MVVAVVTGIVVAGVLACGFTLCRLAIAMLPVIALATPRPKGLRRLPIVTAWEAWLSWFTYDAAPVPGLLQSPVGTSLHRANLTAFATLLATVGLVHSPESPFPPWVQWVQAEQQAVRQDLDAHGAGEFERIRYTIFATGLGTVAIVAFPLLLPWWLAIPLTTPILAEAAAQRDLARDKNMTQAMIAELHSSPDPIERDSVFLGRVVADGSPVLIPRKIFTQHAHGLGDSGSGKTSLFLCPVIEQLGIGQECSIIVIDMKADTHELLASLEYIESVLTQRTKGHRRRRPKVVSNQISKATFAFNPLKQTCWQSFDEFTRTDMLCGATGLNYGTDYGPFYYSTANAAGLYYTIKHFPHATTFHELAVCIGHVLTTARPSELHPEIRKAAVHVQEVMRRLGTCEPLNVTECSGHDPEIVRQSIDLREVFEVPQTLYFHLPATLTPSAGPEIARLVGYMLLAASTVAKRNHPVFLVIDEYQRMVAANLEYMLQLARSMGVGIILANQSMEDLKKGTINLIPPIEANCRLRNWYAVSSEDDRKRLIDSSGVTIDYLRSRSISTNHEGHRTHSETLSEVIVPRFTSTDVSLTSDHPQRSFLRISRGDGYAQYGGLPVIIESDYHISEKEYARRKDLAWPDLPGMFLPSNRPGKADSDQRPLPTLPAPDNTITMEQIPGPHSPELSAAELQQVDDAFRKATESLPASLRSNRRPS